MASIVLTWPETLPYPLVNPAEVGEARPLRTEFETGRIRSRRAYEEVQSTLEVEWNFTADQFETFKAFFDEDLQNGTGSFELEMNQVMTEVVFFESTYSFS